MKVRVCSFGISMDGFCAGPDQSLENPLGVRGPEILEWAYPTRVMQRVVFGKDGGETGTDNAVAEEGFRNIGAWILGRNMFGPIRGPWPDGSWKGWWGEEPPYHVPTYVLTHYVRAPVHMQGGTTFIFSTDGIAATLEHAKVAAKGRDVRIGGGVATVREYLKARLIDELHLAVRPVLLGRGESLFEGIDLPALGYEVEKSVQGERAMHVFLRKRP